MRHEQLFARLLLRPLLGLLLDLRLLCGHHLVFEMNLSLGFSSKTLSLLENIQRAINQKLGGKIGVFSYYSSSNAPV